MLYCNKKVVGANFLSINKAVAKRILKLLKEKQITQYRLEQKSGVFHGAMNRILTGQNKTVTLTTMYKLARGFDMTIFEFMNDEVFRSQDLEID